MSVGINPSKADIDNEIGNLARQLNVLMASLNGFATWAGAQSDGSLMNDKGFAENDIYVFRPAVAKMLLLYQIYTGAVAQGTSAHDFCTELAPVYGFGI